MKKTINLSLLLVLAILLFYSCNKTETPDVPVEPNVSYIINYGSYSGDKTTITSFDKETSNAANNVYENVNGVAITSNVQHALAHDKKVYFMGNNSDQIFWVDGESFEQNENAISEDIIKPRFAVAKGNFLYVSCWGGDIWSDITLSYIAKVNLTSKKVEKKYMVEGGPEGMTIVNNTLYAALNYKKGVAVIDLITDEESLIETPAVTSYFVNDNSGKLYVSLVSTFGNPSEDTGLGVINTGTNSLESSYKLSGVSSGYVNVLAANNDFSKIYVVKEGANWGDPGALAVFDVATKSFASSDLIDDIAGMNGVAYYNDKIFCFSSESATGNGKAIIFNTDGTKDSEFETGIAPFMLLTVK